MAAEASNFTYKEMPGKLPVNRENLETLLKRRMFFCPSFEIYGGVSGLYDYGPPGCAVKANLLNFWRQHFVLEENMLEVDCTSLTPFPVLDASGHVAKFTDLMVKDLVTHQCFRADHLLEDVLEKLLEDPKIDETVRAELRVILAKVDDYTAADLRDLFQRFKVKAPGTHNDLSDPYPFNLMFATSIGPTGTTPGFMRPETAQGIFVNFRRLLDYNGGKVPFAAAQIGQAFRNEISPRSGLLRVREFTLAEIEHFVKPEEKNHPKFANCKDVILHLYPRDLQETTQQLLVTTAGEAVAKGIIDNETLGYFLVRTQEFLLRSGIKKDGLRFRQHLRNEMAHYAKDCWDAEILTSYGWIEVTGHADRSCYDLTVHAKATATNLQVYEAYPEPRMVEVVKVEPNPGLIGKTFRKDAKLVNDFLKSLSEESATQLDVALKGNGSTTIKVDTKEFNLTPDMVQIQKITEKQHGEVFVPHVIEPSYGIGRIIYSILEHSYFVRESDENRGVLSLPPIIAPVKCSVLPLLSNPRILPFVKEISSSLTNSGIANKVDDTGVAIGRRYARTDEIGIPFGVTVDFQTSEDGTVTLRERDSTQQIRVKKEELPILLHNLINERETWKSLWDKYPHQEAATESE